MQNYSIVFEIGKTFNVTEWGLLVLAFTVLGCSGFIRRQLNGGLKPSRGNAIFGFVFVTAICLGFVGSYYSDYKRMTRLAETGPSKVIEGVVHDFKGYPAALKGDPVKTWDENDKKEHFCVNDVCFDYRGYEMAASFHQMRSEGSPIRDGLPVRVTYVDGAIIKLEVGQGSEQQNKN